MAAQAVHLLGAGVLDLPVHQLGEVAIGNPRAARNRLTVLLFQPLDDFVAGHGSSQFPPILPKFG